MVCRMASASTKALVVAGAVSLLAANSNGGIDGGIQHPSYHASGGLLADAFRPAAQPKARHHPERRRLTQRSMCICVDCKWVTSCKAYHFVETKHQQPHMTDAPDFLPREGSPTINVNIRTEPKRRESDDGDGDAVARMWKDQERMPQPQDRDEPAGGGGTQNSGSVPGVASGGTAIESVKTNTTTTIEYDVVKCADFVLDEGCWVRNMPDEIRRVNPNFVPT